MTQNFKKLAIAAGVSVGMAALSMPSYATITGSPGEALLVPLVVYATPDVSGYYANTYIQVSTPGAVGFDDVPNIFVDPNTTPTNLDEETGDVTLFPLDTDLKDAQIHWYWFDHRSVHRLDKPLKVTANDVVMINWADSAKSSGSQYDGQAGYMVIGTEAARRGVPATFNMFGEAWLGMDATDRDGSETVLASIPVYPLSDGTDATDEEGNILLSIGDSVHYKGGIPDAVSPLIAGMRTNRSDGIPDLTAFDLTLVDRTEPAMHVIWLDRNLNEVDGYSTNVPVDVYDTDEVACSSTVLLEHELNVLWINAVDANAVPVNPDESFFAQRPEPLCVPNVKAKLTESSFVTYYIDEYVDTDADRPESAGVAFTLVWGTDGANDAADGLLWAGYASFGQTVLLGHERGLFRD